MKQIPFRIVDIKVENFQILSEEVIRNRKVDVRTDFEFGVNKKAHAVSSKIKYSYMQNNKELLQMILLCVFDVKLEAFNEMFVDNKFIIEPFFSQYLSTINVGAARGEIHARCEMAGSSIANIILPPINLTIPLCENIEIIVG